LFTEVKGFVVAGKDFFLLLVPTYLIFPHPSFLRKLWLEKKMKNKGTIFISTKKEEKIAKKLILAPKKKKKNWREKK
jgi:hypothetical protein